MNEKLEAAEDRLEEIQENYQDATEYLEKIYDFEDSGTLEQLQYAVSKLTDVLEKEITKMKKAIAGMKDEIEEKKKKRSHLWSYKKMRLN